MLINIDHIVDLCGSTRKTVLKRCIDLPKTKGSGRAILYESKDALPLMYNIGNHKSGKKTLEHERTRLAGLQADKVELEVNTLRGKLLPEEHVKEVVDNMVAAFKARLLSLPAKVAPTVVTLIDSLEAEDFIREHIYEALHELSNYESEKYSAPDDKRSGEAGSTPTYPDGKSVGGQQKKTIKRGKRRTGPVEH